MTLQLSPSVTRLIVFGPNSQRDRSQGEPPQEPAQVPRPTTPALSECVLWCVVVCACVVVLWCVCAMSCDVCGVVCVCV